MSKSNTIHNLEEALRIFWLEDSKTADLNLSEKELKLILSSSAGSFDMNKEKREELVNRLFETVNTVSLGQLVHDAIQAENVKEDELALVTRLPVNVVKNLKEDSIFPNNVPVLLLKGLLNKLSISFKAAEKAIWKTFEIMQKRQYLSLDLISSGKSFRRTPLDSSEHTRNTVKRKDGRELFENRESLEKYLSKLSELMTSEPT